MDSALARPELGAAFTAWTVQPLVIAVAVALGVWYVRAVRRVNATGRTRWSRGRTVTFGVGLVLLLWAGTGFWQVYGRSLFWVWTSQTLLLWLLVPIVLLWGHPLQLARALRRDGRVDRVLRSRPARVVSNPLVGPALVPILSFALFFGPLPGWAIATPAVGWPLHLLLVLVGGLMVLPLVGLDDDVSSLAVGLVAGDRLVRAGDRRPARDRAAPAHPPRDELVRPPGRPRLDAAGAARPAVRRRHPVDAGRGDRPAVPLARLPPLAARRRAGRGPGRRGARGRTGRPARHDPRPGGHERGRRRGSGRSASSATCRGGSAIRRCSSACAASSDASCSRLRGAPQRPQQRNNSSGQPGASNTHAPSASRRSGCTATAAATGIGP